MKALALRGLGLLDPGYLVSDRDLGVVQDFSVNAATPIPAHCGSETRPCFIHPLARPGLAAHQQPA